MALIISTTASRDQDAQEAIEDIVSWICLHGFARGIEEDQKTIKSGSGWCSIRVSSIKDERREEFHQAFIAQKSHWVSHFELWNVNCCSSNLADAVADNQSVLFVFDMDSTLIQNECIEELARLAGVYEKVRQLTGIAMSGGMDFRASLLQRLALIGPVKAQSAYQHIIQQVRFTPGITELISRLRGLASVKTAVISGGFIPVMEYVQSELGLDEGFANDLQVDETGQLTGQLVGDQCVDAERKAHILRQLAGKWKIPCGRIVAVGDGANDLLMLGAARPYGVAFGNPPKPTVAQQADIVINSRLDFLLSALGIYS